MTRLVPIVSVLMLLAGRASAASYACTVSEERCQQWATPLPEEQDHPTTVPVDVVVDPARSIVVAAGYARSAPNPFESTARGWVVGLDPDQGGVRWRADLGPPDRFLTIADAALSPDGTFAAVVGKLSDSDVDRPELYVAAVAASNGELLWEWLLPAYSVGRQVAIDAAGTVIVSGFTRAHNQQQLVVAAIGRDGVERGQARWRGPGGDDVPEGLALTPDGGAAIVAVASRGRGGEFDTDIATVAFDLLAGPSPRPRWEARYDFSGAGAQDLPRAITLSPDGTTAYVTGTSNAANQGPPFAVDFDAVTLAYGVDRGEQRWVSRWRPPGDDFPNPAGLVATDNRVIVTLATPEPDGEGSDIAVVGLDAASGAQAWMAKAATPLHDLERPSAIAVAPSGATVAVTGVSSVSGVSREGTGMDQMVSGDQITLAYDAVDGRRRWHARFGDGAVVTGPALAMAGDDDVYAAAEVHPPTAVDRDLHDAVIVAYLG